MATSRLVLTWHRVVDDDRHPWDLSWSSFRAILDRLVGVRHTTALEVAPGPGREVALTFDDGTIDHFGVATELARRGIAGIFYVSPGALGEPGHLTADDVGRIRGLGHRIGSHGFTHRRLGGMSLDEAVDELAAADAWLKAFLGEDVTTFAPPGGLLPSALEPVVRARYSSVRLGRWGIDNGLDDRWSLPTVPVTRATLAAGWVDRALRTGRLPVEARLVGQLRNAIPSSRRRRWNSAFQRAVDISVRVRRHG